MANLSRAALVFCLCILNGLLIANFVSATEKIDINNAPLEDLVKIIHIGKVRALELISLRPFSSLDDLTRINGIGEKRVEDIKKQGLAWVTDESQSEQKPEIMNYPTGIVLNEVLPSPEGPDAENEWIEIFNQNNFEVNLSQWQIVDTIGQTKIYTFPEGTKISSQGFLVLSRPATKITLNNDGDGLSLIQPDGNIIDTLNYEKAPQGESYNLTESGWAWSSILTPGATNKIPAPVKEIKEVEEETKSEKELAAISQPFQSQTKPTSKSFLVFLIASALAIFSGLIILFLKKKIKTSYNKNV